MRFMRYRVSDGAIIGACDGPKDVPPAPDVGFGYLAAADGADPWEWKVDLAAPGGPALEARDEVPHLTTALSVLPLASVTITCGVSPVWVQVPGQNPVLDQDGIIIWSSDTPGSYELTLWTDLHRKTTIAVEVLELP